MKKNILNLCILLITIQIIFIFSSCEKVKNPYAKNTSPGGGPTETLVRKILIEDYTGHTCGNCPAAAVTIETIKALYPGQIISMSVHVENFALPGQPPFNDDFRTTVGNDYDVFFKPTGFPIGMVNRKDYSSGGQWKDVAKWQTIIDTLAKRAPDADIKITNNYNTSSRVLTTSIRSKFLSALGGKYKLAVLLTEDSIIAPQKDYSKAPNVDILNYVHHFVLRNTISSTSFGDDLNSQSVAVGDSIIKPYTYTLPATYKGRVPNENQCYVVAYIYDASTYEIIQADQKKIK